MSSSGNATAPGKPPGSIPMLRLPDGTFIKQSIAILDYLEDMCDNPIHEWQVLASKMASPRSMRGNTLEERARTREILSLADELTSQFGFAAHKGSKLFVELEETSKEASRLMMESCKKTGGLIEAYYQDEERMLERESTNVTIADCVLFAILQFADRVYNVQLYDNVETPNLARFYANFKTRKSTQVPPEDLANIQALGSLASQWLY